MRATDAVLRVMAAAGHGHGGVPSLDAALVGVALVAVIVYATGAAASRRRGRPWPWYRVAAWCCGVAAATAAVSGPLARASHDSFVAHTWAHLLAGMAAPVLLVLAAPVTLALRTLPVVPARRVSRLLGSAPARILAHPVTAAILSAGGLWLIYLSPIHELMRADTLAHVAVHGHLLLAGYLFTAAIIGLDPAPHAPSRVVRALVLIAAMASHSILAKHLYAYPPADAPADTASGAELMYYAGAWIEAVVVVIFCARWYRAAGRSIRVREPSRT